MKKPSWNDAPEWAQYLAMDAEGDWYWYEVAPFYAANGGVWCGNGEKVCLASAVDSTGPESTCEARP